MQCSGRTNIRMTSHSWLPQQRSKSMHKVRSNTRRTNIGHNKWWMNIRGRLWHFKFLRQCGQDRRTRIITAFRAMAYRQCWKINIRFGERSKLEPSCGSYNPGQWTLNGQFTGFYFLLIFCANTYNYWISCASFLDTTLPRQRRKSMLKCVRCRELISGNLSYRRVQNTSGTLFEAHKIRRSQFFFN